VRKRERSQVCFSTICVSRNFVSYFASGVTGVGVAGAGYPRVTEITCESESGRKFVSRLFVSLVILAIPFAV
jgi:hypothetical protein